MEIVYRPLAAEEIDRELFAHFIRKQVVSDCRRKADGAWIIVNAPFIDDWNESDYEFLVRVRRHRLHPRRGDRRV